MVNIKTAHIFNGIFKSGNSRENTQNSREYAQKNAWRTGVYHVRINHDAPPREANGLLGLDAPVQTSAPTSGREAFRRDSRRA